MGRGEGGGGADRPTQKDSCTCLHWPQKEPIWLLFQLRKKFDSFFPQFGPLFNLAPFSPRFLLSQFGSFPNLAPFGTIWEHLSTHPPPNIFFFLSLPPGHRATVGAHVTLREPRPGLVGKHSLAGAVCYDRSVPNSSNSRAGFAKKNSAGARILPISSYKKVQRGHS